MLALLGIDARTRLGIYKSKAVRLIAFPLVFVLALGFFTARTYLFELDGNTVKQQVCVETDYDESGERCVGEEAIQKSFRQAMDDHITGAAIIGVIGGLVWLIGSYVGVKEAEDEIESLRELRNQKRTTGRQY